ncbi:MAG: hypothetical protein KGM44_05755 [bacterium]|nr:hypothetical protein [bacterium]
MTSEPLDAQTISLLGRDKVIEQLHRAGLEVALPRRDRGIDIIAYADKAHTFQALPIQIKASAGFRWVVNEKYGSFADIVIAFVMHLGDEGRSVVYALPHAENLAIAERLGFTQRYATWLKPKRVNQGGYIWIDRPMPELLAALEPYRASTDGWLSLLRRSLSSPPVVGPGASAACDTRSEA